MALETGTYISDLNAKNPTPGDPKSQGDDNIRLIKETLLNTLPLVKGPIPIAHDQFASKDYVNNAAFSAILPGQPGGTITYTIRSLGGVATWVQRPTPYSDAEMLAQTHAIALAN